MPFLGMQASGAKRQKGQLTPSNRIMARRVLLKYNVFRHWRLSWLPNKLGLC